MIYPCACGVFLHVFRNIVMAFLVPLLGSTNPSGDAKKHQQAFLAPLPGKALVKKNLLGDVHDNKHV